ncbi:hypothetical protein DFR86_02920 [Acidianus sulfidivorans JP7]|uniref:Uncharacterized protein n=1 Tax=Acidianus sulfidivorans JP7 TaxID=619593 RepID=A0A2U9IKU0_9CREN|nr:hypothetical protein [Acidianus sulfidivorans]AWR96605.1 hypothetical protein DFR86_02920 [Acidianus sulfidivorans JP7]
MKVKIKSLVNVVGHEELYVIPITYNGIFLLGLNFYEEVEGGRTARFIIVKDNYGEIDDKVRIISGYKGIVEAEGIEEDYKTLSKYIKIEKTLKSNRIPIFVNIEIKQNSENYARGIQGYLNYISKYGEINPLQLKDKIKLEIEELI